MEKEIRAHSGEVRAASEGRTIEGYAAIYNEETDLGYFREMIMPGAFEGADMDDVRALFNHDSNYVLGRTKSGTLTLTPDERGLKYRIQVPNTAAGNDMLELVRRGDISQSSFAFIPDVTSWVEETGKPMLRKIEKFAAIFDVSPVTYPAYESTSVSVRSAQQIMEERTKVSIEIEIDTDPQPEAEPMEPETDGMKKPKQMSADERAEQIQNELRQMDERVREAQFSLIQTSLHNDY